MSNKSNIYHTSFNFVANWYYVYVYRYTYIYKNTNFAAKKRLVVK